MTQEPHPLAQDILTYREWKSQREHESTGRNVAPCSRANIQNNAWANDMSKKQQRGARSSVQDREMLHRCTAQQLEGKRTYRDGRGAVREAWNRPKFEPIDDRQTHPTNRTPAGPGPSTAFYRSVYEKVDDRGATRREKIQGLVYKKEQNVVAQQHYSFWGSYKFESRANGTLSLEDRAYERYKRPKEEPVEVARYFLMPPKPESKKTEKKPKKIKKKKHFWFKHVKGDWTPAKVMPLFSLRTMILKIYADKIEADNTDIKEALKAGKVADIDELEEYVVEWMQYQYGDKMMVMAKLRDLRKSVLQHSRNDKFIKLFSRFCKLTSEPLYGNVLTPCLDAMEKMPQNHLDNLERKEVGRIGDLQGVKEASMTVALVPKESVLLELELLVRQYPGVELQTYVTQLMETGLHKSLLVLDADAMRHLGVIRDQEKEVLSGARVFCAFVRLVLDSLVASGINPEEPPPMDEGLEQPSTVSVQSTGSRGPKAIRIAAGSKVDLTVVGGLSVFQ
jgi:hypothetical protein